MSERNLRVICPCILRFDCLDGDNIQFEIPFLGAKEAATVISNSQAVPTMSSPPSHHQTDSLDVLYVDRGSILFLFATVRSLQLGERDWDRCATFDRVIGDFEVIFVGDRCLLSYIS